MSERHHRAISLLLQSRFAANDEDRLTQEQIASELGIRRETLYDWRQAPEFVAAYDEAVEDYKRDLESVPYTVRRHRIEERVRLYRKIPDSKPTQKNAVLDAIEREAQAAEDQELEDLVADLRRQLAALEGRARLKVQTGTDGE